MIAARYSRRRAACAAALPVLPRPGRSAAACSPPEGSPVDDARSHDARQRCGRAGEIAYEGSNP